MQKEKSERKRQQKRELLVFVRCALQQDVLHMPALITEREPSLRERARGRDGEGVCVAGLLLVSL